MSCHNGLLDERLRVLYVHSGNDIYGASRSLLRLVTGLDRRLVDPHVALPSEGELAGKLRQSGIDVAILPDLRVISRPILRSWRLWPFIIGLPLSILRLSRFIRRNRFDIVHTNTGVVVSSGAAARLAFVPHVWHVRDSFRQFGALWPMYARYVRWSSAWVVCVSRSVAEQFGPARDHLTVIHNALPAEACVPAPDEAIRQFRWRWALNGKQVVGLVGRIKLERKGHEVLAHAAALLMPKFDNLRFLVVGSPFPGNEEHLEQLLRLVKSLGVAERFIFVGEQDDVKPAYGAMDMLVVPSCDPEPFAGVVLEAMALGLPVIGSRIGGTPEQIEDGVSGLLTTPGDAGELAAAVERVLVEDDLRRRLSAGARCAVRDRFMFDVMLKKVMALYKSCV
jgi:glycosyltransferase involved in cell wall biosynthesis